MFIERQYLTEDIKQTLMQQGFQELYTVGGNIKIEKTIEPYEVIIPMIREFATHLRIRDNVIEYHGKIKKGFWFLLYQEALSILNEHRSRQIKEEASKKYGTIRH